jgi:hypothetical protein
VTPIPTARRAVPAALVQPTRRHRPARIRFKRISSFIPRFARGLPLGRTRHGQHHAAGRAKQGAAR